MASPISTDSYLTFATLFILDKGGEKLLLSGPNGAYLDIWEMRSNIQGSTISLDG